MHFRILMIFLLLHRSSSHIFYFFPLLTLMPRDKYILAVWCFHSCAVEEILILDLFKETSFCTVIIQSSVAACIALNIHSREYSAKPQLPPSQMDGEHCSKWSKSFTSQAVFEFPKLDTSDQLPL